MSNKNRIIIFTGYFGSGKTEFSINKSIELAAKGKKVMLVDLDIVNPFFRSAEMKSVLEAQGVEVITPEYANTNVDLPTLPPEIFKAFNTQDTEVIIDVGGDGDGARALGCFYPYLKDEDFELNFIVNTLRPFTSQVDEILKVALDVEKKSRLEITHFISNTNLAGETELDMVMEGFGMVSCAAAKIDKPISLVGVPSNLEGQLPESLKSVAYPIKRYMKPQWEY